MANTTRSNFKWVLLIFICVFAVLAYTRPAKTLIPWQTNYTNASIQARTDHKLILLDFYADWCGPCRAMAADTWSDKSVADAVSNYVPVHVNVDDDPQLSQHFGVEGIPNMLVLDGNGKILAHHVGQMGPSEFLTWLHDAGKSVFAYVGQ
jgi:thiol:disulfide interchange protein